MDPQTRTASSEGDTRGGPPPPEEPQRAELSVVEPGPEPTAAALPVSSALDARFLALAGTLGELVSLHEPGRGCVYASAVTRSLLGADPADLVGRDWTDLVPPEDTNPFAGDAPAHVSHRLLRPYGQMPVAAIVIDLDHLAAVSTRFGRDASDRVLAETASRMQATLRPSDLLGRLEKERLCALCLGVGDSQSALRIAERIRSVVARPLPFEPVIATASVGAALTAPAGDPEALLRRATRAAKAVKRQGGNAAFLDGI